MEPPSGLILVIFENENIEFIRKKNMRIHQDPEFQVNFNREALNQPLPPAPAWVAPVLAPPRTQEDTGEAIPEPYCFFTTDKQMSSVQRGQLLAIPGKFKERIKKYVRDRWPILGSFHDRTNSWGRCFLKCKLIYLLRC